MTQAQEFFACLRDYDLRYILIKFRKKTTYNNLLLLRQARRVFQGNKKYSPHSWDKFSEYINNENFISKLD